MFKLSNLFVFTYAVRIPRENVWFKNQQSRVCIMLCFILSTCFEQAPIIIGNILASSAILSHLTLSLLSTLEWIHTLYPVIIIDKPSFESTGCTEHGAISIHALIKTPLYTHLRQARTEPNRLGATSEIKVLQSHSERLQQSIFRL